MVNLHTIIIVATNSTHILPNHVQLCTADQRSMVIVLDKQELKDAVGGFRYRVKNPPPGVDAASCHNA